MNLAWVTDPVTKQPSVSLTIMIASFVSVIIVGWLNSFALIKETSIFTEVFYSSCALYFGRRLSVNNKQYSSDKAQDIISNIEKETK